MDSNRVELPCHLPIWPRIKTSLTGLQEKCRNQCSTVDDIINLLNTLCELTGADDFPSWQKKRPKGPRSKDRNGLPWYGFEKFLKKSEQSERQTILHGTLPAIIQLALDIENFPSTDIKLSNQQHESTVTLSRSCIASLLACGFLCLYPSRHHTNFTKLNQINFISIFKNLPLPSQVAKLRCLFHYFDKITSSEKERIGNVTYTRKCLEQSRIPVMEDYTTSDQELCSLVVHHDGCLEDIGSRSMEVDFANRFIGGGSLGKGAVQEEIRFMACPELIASQLFMECMEDNEAIIISGYKQYSMHSGYASTFAYEGDYIKPVDGDNMLCCIDATTFRNKSKKIQYTERYILREINKALIGFSGPDLLSDQKIDIENVSLKEGTSSDDEFHTALEFSDDDQSPRYISNFANQMLRGLLSQATREVVEKNKKQKKAKRVTKPELMAAAGNVVFSSHIHQPHSTELSDGLIIVGSTEQLNNPNNLLTPNFYDGMDVISGDWLNNFRRRSSNLSEVNSRRSSSSTKHSSDISSDLDELYDCYIKSEKSKHGIIHEESAETISDFAAKLISCLMQEGTSKAASMLPGIQDFDMCPPLSAIKPQAQRDQDSKLSKEFAVAERVADKMLKSVFTFAMLEAVSIIGTNKTSNDNASNTQHSQSADDKIPDSTYLWFADHIVQDAFLQASEDFSRPEIQIHNVINYVDPNISCDSLSSGGSNQPRLSISSIPDDMDQNLSGYDSSVSSLGSENKSSSYVKNFHPKDKVSGRVHYYSGNSNKNEDVASLTGIQIVENVEPNCENSVISDNETKTISLNFNLNDAAAVIVKKVINGIPRHLEEDSEHSSILMRTPSDHCVKFNDSVLEAENMLGKDQIYTVTFAEDQSGPLPWSNFSKKEDRHKRNEISNVGILTKKLSRETVTNAYLKVENRRKTKSYERRSSEPCHTSVQHSLRALDNEKAACDMDKRNRKISRTDEDFDRFKADSKRRGSWDIMPSSRRRSSCGFKDPVLSSFAEELMKADTSIPPLQIAEIPSSSTTGSRRSSISAFRDLILANFEMELLGSSFEAPSSPLHNSTTCQYQDSKLVRSDSSEYMWFPPPRRVGVEFQEDYERLQNYHSVDEIEDFADLIAQNVLQDAVDILNREQEEILQADKIRAMECYAEEVSLCVLDSAFTIIKKHAKKMMILSSVSQKNNPPLDLRTDSCDDFQDALDINIQVVEQFANKMAAKVIKDVMIKLFRSKHRLDEFINGGRSISTGNWGCGAFRGDPHLKSLLQWIAASIVQTPTLHYFLFSDPKLVRFEEVINFIREKNWNVGDVMKVIQQYCDLLQDDIDFIDDDMFLPITLFDYLLTF